MKTKKNRRKKNQRGSGGSFVGKYGDKGFESCNSTIDQVMQKMAWMFYSIDPNYYNRSDSKSFKILTEVYEESKEKFGKMKLDLVNSPVVTQDIFYFFITQGFGWNTSDINVLDLDKFKNINLYIRKEDNGPQYSSLRKLDDGIPVKDSEYYGKGEGQKKGPPSRVVKFYESLERGYLNLSDHNESILISKSNFIQINEKIKQNSINIIVSHANYMMKLQRYMAYKNKTDLNPPEYEKRYTNNLDALCIVLDGTDGIDEKNIKYCFYDNNSSGYKIIIEELKKNSKLNYSYILLFRHCPGCHNLDYRFKKTTMGKNIYKSKYGNNLLSLCLDSTLDNFGSLNPDPSIPSGFITSEKFNELFDFIRANLIVNFYSSIIFRAMLTCSLLCILYNKNNSIKLDRPLNSEIPEYYNIN